VRIKSTDEITDIYGLPDIRSKMRVLDHLDKHCQNFIKLSPFYVISSSRLDGQADASPRGDPPGYAAYVLNERTLLLPDRSGNKQVDTLRNVVEQPYVGLLFLIPGFYDCMRVNGKAEISTDIKLRELLAIEDDIPISVLIVSIQDVFMHCRKALRRSRLWDEEAKLDRNEFTDYRQIVSEHIETGRAPDLDVIEDSSTNTPSTKF